LQKREGFGNNEGGMKKNSSEAKTINVVPLKEEKVLFSWQALARPYQKKTRDFWVTAFSSVGLVCLILFVVGEWVLIAALLALLFLYYVLTTVEPEKVAYRVTTKGVYLPGLKQKISWDFLKSFYFTEKWGYPLLKIDTYLVNLPVISLVILKKDKEKLAKIFKKYLPLGEEEENLADKISHWLYRHLPFEEEKRKKKKSPS